MNELPYNEAVALLQGSKRLLLVSHRRPDGDTLGANIALSLALQQMGKTTDLVCIDEVSERLRFLPEIEKFKQEFNMYEYDAIIICDAGAHHMTGFHEKYPDFLSKKVPILNIDHHASNEGFGSINLVDAKASSATVMVYRLLQYLPVTITKDMAFALLTGIYNDTGGMMHSNTTQETFEISAALQKTGVNIYDISKPLMRDATIGQLKLWGHILENLKKNDKGIVSSVVSEDDFKRIGSHGSDTGGIVDLMNTVPDSTFTLLLAEDDGCVKGSLRTQREDVNLSDVAGRFGGGGHKKASGFRVQGRLQRKVVWSIVPQNGDETTIALE